MLQWFYNELGFVGSIFASLTLFLVFIFWFSGLAGIAALPEKNKTKNIKLILGVLIPVFPVGWLIYDIWRQKRILSGKS